MELQLNKVKQCANDEMTVKDANTAANDARDRKRCK